MEIEIEIGKLRNFEKRQETSAERESVYSCKRLLSYWLNSCVIKRPESYLEMLHEKTSKVMK